MPATWISTSPAPHRRRGGQVPRSAISRSFNGEVGARRQA
jgi:hypothetical protein